ncbi:unnamed protein product [Sphagnum jensenii]|uniref:Uncharacterized protein n=1 Tax=Sphagnum jensenii TaxID=128206 RepID=A0ABP0W736_9BRYO
MIEIRITFRSVGFPGDSLLERKLRVKPLLSLSRWRELTYWRSSRTDMCYGLWIFQEAYTCGINIHVQKV